MNEVTELLQRAAAGDSSARDPLYRILYPLLMRLARGHLARVATTSLDASGVLHEAFLRLNQTQRLPDENRNTFLAYASTVMHSVIVDYVRAKYAKKRGGDWFAVTLSGDLQGSIFGNFSVLEIEDALRALERSNERAFRVVEMRYFGGMSEAEIAVVLDVSLPTVKRDWSKARAFLYERLT